MGLLNQALAFVTFFSQVKKNILGPVVVSHLGYTSPYYTVYLKSRVLSVFPLSSDASTHFQIETPSSINDSS